MRFFLLFFWACFEQSSIVP